MKIESFITKSQGDWRSMRSGHSLAFQQFEEVISVIKIRRVSSDSKEIKEAINQFGKDIENIISPFSIEWQAESNWEETKKEEGLSGFSYMLPIPTSKNSGLMIRTKGYTEVIRTASNYFFLSDDTFVLTTHYENTTAEERIWFLSENVRCRSSVIRAKNNGILQTSFASEIRLKAFNKEV